MRRRLLCLILLLLPLAVFCQNSVVGRVADIATKKPLAGTTVFLKNTTIGTATNDEGVFTLAGVPNGVYDVVVTIIGYESFHQRIIVNRPRVAVPTIELLTRVNALREVRVRPDENWFRLYTRFKKAFLGETDNARQCKILNPEAIDLKYNKRNEKITAKSDTFIVIVNRALGYRIRYLLNKFELSVKHNDLSMIYEGSPVFDELHGTPAEERQWQKARAESYLGSAMNFFRTAAKGNLEKQGFAVRMVTEVPNPRYSRGNDDNRVLQSISESNLNNTDFIDTTDRSSVYVITRPLLYAMYTRKTLYTTSPINARFNMPEYASTIIRLNAKYAFFDANGVVINPESLSYDGYWAAYRVGDQLPADYRLPETNTANQSGKTSK